MNVFFIRNYISVISSQSIIIQFHMKESIGVIVERGDTPGYAENIKKIMDQNLWSKVVILPFNCLFLFESSGKNKILRTLERVSYNNKRWSLLKKEVFDFLLHFDIECLFITAPGEPLEKLVYYYAGKKKISINSYEEGASHYCKLDRGEQFFKFILIKKLIYIKNPYFIKEPDTFLFDDVYCFMPECYNKKNFRGKIIKVIPNFKDKNIQNTAKEIDCDILLLTSPLSEDGILSVADEKELMSKILRQFNSRKILYKPHPRESKEKIKDFVGSFKLNLVKSDLLDVPAELIVENSTINCLIGVHSSTLLYESVLNPNVKVYSFLKTLIGKDFSFNDAYNDFKRMTDKIIYI
jgi:hypothetical protein